MRRALALLVATFAAAGCGGGSPCGPDTGVVSQVIDGDTIVLKSGVKIRYLLINSPEITKGHNDCYGQQARTFNADLVFGQTVNLAYDKAACTDHYGRTLAYVSVGGRELNSMEVERGYACVDYIPPAGESRHTEFEAMESQARAQLRGMWGACQSGPCFP